MCLQNPLPGVTFLPVENQSLGGPQDIVVRHVGSHCTDLALLAGDLVPQYPSVTIKLTSAPDLLQRANVRIMS
jgi:hypothetical protein